MYAATLGAIGQEATTSSGIVQQIIAAGSQWQTSYDPTAPGPKTVDPGTERQRLELAALRAQLAQQQAEQMPLGVRPAQTAELQAAPTSAPATRFPLWLKVGVAAAVAAFALTRARST